MENPKTPVFFGEWRDSTRWIDRRVRALRLPDVTAYLRKHGWRELPADRKGFLIFQEPSGELVDGRPFCQFVPAYESCDDYPLRMFELLSGLAEFEDRQASEVIDDILRLANDPANGTAQKQVVSGSSDSTTAAAGV